MAKITINQDRCKGCLLCIAFCPKGLIVIDERLNSKGVKPVKFSRQAIIVKGGIPPPVVTGSRHCRVPMQSRDPDFIGKKAGKKGAECLGCAMCAIICPDCCIEVYK